MREDAILHKMQTGDPSGLESLMDIYIPYVSTVVWNILRGAMSQEDGEEVVSDVFLAAWQQSSELKPGFVKGWLAAVARNKAKNKLRKMGKTLPLEDDFLDIPGPNDPLNDVEQAEEQQLVRKAIQSLPEQDQEIFLRYYYYAQTIQEISLGMAINESTIKTRLRRGRAKLKEILTRKGFVNEA
ncbi:RNA polymerase sigma factor [Eubacteriales bacterium SGI.150]